MDLYIYSIIPVINWKAKKATLLVQFQNPIKNRNFKKLFSKHTNLDLLVMIATIDNSISLLLISDLTLK